MNPTISAIIPTYNYGRFLGLAIDSVLAQTAPASELIVVDDGSTDDTRERLAPYGDRVRYLYQPNRGLAAARNTGIRAAHGDWVAFLDSDDVWSPGKLAAQVAAAQQYPEAALVATDRHHFESQLPPDVDPQVPAPPPVRPVSFADLLERSLFAPSSVMIRKQCLAEVGLFDEDLRAVEDLDLWLRIAAGHVLLRVEAPLIGMRLHEQSLSTKADLNLVYYRKVLAKIPGYLPEWRWHARWRGVARARMYREVAWMRYTAGDRRGAVADLVRSIASWPLALADRSGHKQRGRRARSLVAWSLRPPPAAHPNPLVE